MTLNYYLVVISPYPIATCQEPIWSLVEYNRGELVFLPGRLITHSHKEDGMLPNHTREVLNSLSGKGLRDQCVGFQRPVVLRMRHLETRRGEKTQFDFLETHGRLNPVLHLACGRCSILA